MPAIAPGWEVDIQRGPDWLLVKVRTDSQSQQSHGRTSAVEPDAVGPDAVGPDAVGPDAVGPDAVGPDATELASGIWDLMQRHFAHRLVLEMDQVGLLDSHLIGQLIHLYKLIREHDGVMRLCGLSPHNLRVLRTCRLDDRFQSYVDCKEAVLGRSRAVCPR